MATKYSEAVLGLQFREQLPDGSVAGGPMYYLRNGVRSPVLAWMFAFLAGMAAMTTGPLAQTNSMALVLNTEFYIPKWLTGAGIAIGAWLVIIGGIKSIARFAEKLVPLKVVLYVGGSLYIILAHIELLPQTVALIVKSAFTPTAMIGGFSGVSAQHADSTRMRRDSGRQGWHTERPGAGTLCARASSRPWTYSSSRSSPAP